MWCWLGGCADGRNRYSRWRCCRRHWRAANWSRHRCLIGVGVGGDGMLRSRGRGRRNTLQCWPRVGRLRLSRSACVLAGQVNNVDSPWRGAGHCSMPVEYCPRWRPISWPQPWSLPRRLRRLSESQKVSVACEEPVVFGRKCIVLSFPVLDLGKSLLRALFLGPQCPFQLQGLRFHRLLLCLPRGGVHGCPAFHFLTRGISFICEFDDLASEGVRIPIPLGSCRLGSRDVEAGGRNHSLDLSVLIVRRDILIGGLAGEELPERGRKFGRSTGGGLRRPIRALCLGCGCRCLGRIRRRIHRRIRWRIRFLPWWALLPDRRRIRDGHSCTWVIILPWAFLLVKKRVGGRITFT